MDNLGVLVPAAISLKDAIATLEAIENFLKGSSDRPGASPQDLMRDFLTGGNALGLNQGLDNAPETVVEVPQAQG